MGQPARRERTALGSNFMSMGDGRRKQRLELRGARLVAAKASNKEISTTVEQLVLAHGMLNDVVLILCESLF